MHRGIGRYLATNSRGKKGQSGFTLIELLVVVTILGILAAIVTLSLVGLTTNAQSKACEQEYKTVQAGLDAYMAYFNLDAITAQGPTATNDMTVKPDGTDPLYNAAGTPTFLRNTPTQWAYTWDSTGRILTIAQVSGGPAKPTTCTVSGA
jgi:prepilin-type N-terminal cleavage/methylation domain-containing protein